MFTRTLWKVGKDNKTFLSTAKVENFQNRIINEKQRKHSKSSPIFIFVNGFRRNRQNINQRLTASSQLLFWSTSYMPLKQCMHVEKWTVLAKRFPSIFWESIYIWKSIGLVTRNDTPYVWTCAWMHLACNKTATRHVGQFLLASHFLRKNRAWWNKCRSLLKTSLWVFYLHGLWKCCASFRLRHAQSQSNVFEQLHVIPLLCAWSDNGFSQEPVWVLSDEAKFDHPCLLPCGRCFSHCLQDTCHPGYFNPLRIGHPLGIDCQKLVGSKSAWQSWGCAQPFFVEPWDKNTIYFNLKRSW